MPRRILPAGLAGLSLLTVLLANVPAQSGNRPEPEPKDTPVTIRIQNQSPADTLRQICQSVGLDCDFSPALLEKLEKSATHRVTVSLRDVPLDQVLRVIARKVVGPTLEGLVYTIDGRNCLLETNPVVTKQVVWLPDQEPLPSVRQVGPVSLNISALDFNPAGKLRLAYSLTLPEDITATVNGESGPVFPRLLLKSGKTLRLDGQTRTQNTQMPVRYELESAFTPDRNDPPVGLAWEVRYWSRHRQRETR